MDTKLGFSLQVELIRQMQTENGHEACYATPATVGCTKKQSECSWRHDCFHDAEEADDASESWSAAEAEAEEADKSWLDGDAYQCGSDFSSR